MREIKFKAYNKKEKRWLDSDELCFSHGCWFENFKALEDYNALPVDQGEVVIMQYTGLDDENDKEIYEGDIIKTNKGELFVVKENYGRFGFYKEVNLDFYGYNPEKIFHTLCGNGFRDCEIVGNFHENCE